MVGTRVAVEKAAKAEGGVMEEEGRLETGGGTVH